MNQHRFVFVCGLHRSGTSLLFRSLRDHPLLSGFQNTGSPEDEGMHLQTVYPPSGRYGGAGEFGFHAEAHLTEDSPLVSEENRRRLFHEWARYWDLEKPYLLEKSPPNLIRARFLQAMFPDSYFIVLLRHPLAVSYATRAWYRRFRVYWRSLSRILEHWLVCHEIFLADRPYLKRVMILTYENFVADPSAWLNNVYTFLGVEPVPVRQTVLTGVNEKYFAMWRREQQNPFTRWQARSLIRRLEPRVRRFGYSLVDLNRVAPPDFL